MKRPHFYFWQGVVFYIGFSMFHQDWIGKTEYLRLVDEKWWDIHWIWGFLIMCIGLGSHLLFRWALADYRKDHPEK